MGSETEFVKQAACPTNKEEELEMVPIPMASGPDVSFEIRERGTATGGTKKEGDETYVEHHL